MCGIIGILGVSDVTDRLVSGLKRLEYRGYDSSGVATITDGVVKVCKTVGKIKDLEVVLDKSNISGNVGIAHTRWATHGRPNAKNAHPHSTDTVAIVHNGIIENYKELREYLAKQGISCSTETDSEVISLLITHFFNKTGDYLKAINQSLPKLEGSYALGIIFHGNEDCLYAVRKGSPLVIGKNKQELFLGSDAIALSDFVDDLAYLEDGDVVSLSRTGISVYDSKNVLVERRFQKCHKLFTNISKDSYDHFMLKEIYEQPEVVANTLSNYVKGKDLLIDGLNFDVVKSSKINIVACGTSYYAGCVAKYWFEQIAGISVEVDIASEFRYRKPPMLDNGCAIFISQSGETADTMAALQYVNKHKQDSIGIVNVPDSSIAREVGSTLMTYAGPEIGVASTKAFLTQLSVLAVLALYFGYKRGKITQEKLAVYLQQLQELPKLIKECLNQNMECCAVANKFINARSMLYIGRGVTYPIALEGALKIKEISYIHSEGYASGEMKHGPIALVDDKMPIVALAPSDELFDKTISNIQEASARDGQIILLSDQKGHSKYDGASARVMLPSTSKLTAPFVYTIPVQLLAYYMAVIKGCDVDQPRNLAKSVTVE